MTDQPTIRVCLLEEASELLHFWQEAAASESPTDDFKGVSVLFSVREDAVLIAEEGGRIVGSVIAGFDGWRGNIYRLAVHPDQRRKGLGRRLVAEAERRLAARGAKRLTALASRHSPLSIPFWDSLADIGWKPTHPRERYAKTL